VKFDGFSLFFLWAVFVIGSSSSIGFFRSHVLLWFETIYGFLSFGVFVAGISEKWPLEELLHYFLFSLYSWTMGWLAPQCISFSVFLSYFSPSP
jgi:hypothetical protein